MKYAVVVRYTLAAEDTETKREWWETYATYDSKESAYAAATRVMIMATDDYCTTGVRIDEVEK